MGALNRSEWRLIGTRKHAASKLPRRRFSSRSTGTKPNGRLMRCRQSLRGLRVFRIDCHSSPLGDAEAESRCEGLVQGISEHRCSSSRTSSAAPPSEKTVKSASRISRSTPDERAFQSQRDLELEELHNLFRECKHDAAAIISRLEVGARCPPPPCHWNSKPATFPPKFAARAR